MLSQCFFGTLPYSLKGGNTVARGAAPGTGASKAVSPEKGGIRAMLPAWEWTHSSPFQGFKIEAASFPGASPLATLFCSFGAWPTGLHDVPMTKILHQFRNEPCKSGAAPLRVNPSGNPLTLPAPPVFSFQVLVDVRRLCNGRRRP